LRSGTAQHGIRLLKLFRRHDLRDDALGSREEEGDRNPARHLENDQLPEMRDTCK
jgi:hypothetical protein